MGKESFQFSLKGAIRISIFMALLGYLLIYPSMADFLCGPMYLVKYWTTHFWLGVSWSLILLFPISIWFLKPNWLTAIISILGIAAWIASYLLIIEVEACV